MQMQLELQGYDMSQMDPEMQQQLLMSMDPMMMYGMEPGDEEDMEGDQWLPPDNAFLQQHMGGGQGGENWGGVDFAGEEEEYDEYYEDEDHQVQQGGGRGGGEDLMVGGASSKSGGASGSKQGSPTARIPTGGGIPSPAAAAVDDLDESMISDASIEIGGDDFEDDDDDADF